MKKLLFLASLLISSINFAQVKWLSLTEALEAQKTNPKKILINFYTDWCIPCNTMDSQTYSNPIISSFINEKYYPVKFNSEYKEKLNIFGRIFTNSDPNSKQHLHEFTQFMNVNSVPATVFIDEQTMPITTINGFLSAKELEPYLSFIANNTYQKIKNREEWDDYQRKFKSKIEE